MTLPDDIEIIRTARHSLPNIGKLQEFRLTHPYSENLGKTNGVNNPGKSGGHEMLLVGLVKLFHCLYSFRGCAQASGMSLIHLREGERRNRKE